MQAKEKTIRNKPKRLTPLRFYSLSVLIGIVGGVGAVVFRGMISVFHNLFFLGKLSVVYDANTHTPASPWGPWVILVPVLGAVGVAFLVKNFAPEAKGHGVPEVMDASLGAVYWQRWVDWPGRTHYPNRSLLWLDDGPAHPYAGLAKNHVSGSRGRGRHRRNL